MRVVSCRAYRTRVQVALSAVVLVFASSQAVAQSTISPTLSRGLDNVLEQFMAVKNIGAGALGVMRNGTIIYNKSFGWKDARRRLSLPDDAMFRVASLTKPITAAAVRDLVRKGMLSLDQKVFDVGQPRGGILDLDPWPKLGDSRISDITVDHLLRHRGGWDRAQAGKDLTYRDIAIAQAMGVRSPPGRERVVRYILGQPLQYTPGTGSWTYHNINYLVLGLVIEKVSGRDYMTYVRENIFAPLGVDAEDVIQGRTRPVERSPREPWYDRDSTTRDVFNPNGPRVRWP